MPVGLRPGPIESEDVRAKVGEIDIDDGALINARRGVALDHQHMPAVALRRAHHEGKLFLIQIEGGEALRRRVGIRKKEQAGGIFQHRPGNTGEMQRLRVLKGKADTAVELPVFAEHFLNEAAKTLIAEQIRRFIDKNIKASFAQPHRPDRFGDMRDNRRPQLVIA